MKAWLTHQAGLWISRRVPPEPTVTLVYRNIFIFPVRSALTLVTVALLIFVAAANYGLSLGFALCFLMLSGFVVNILYTFRNLQGMRIEAVNAEPVFCGDTASFRVRLVPAENRVHEAVYIGFRGQEVRQRVDVVAPVTVKLTVRTTHRGLMPMPRLRLESVFPLGLCRAWADPALTQKCLVYPTPVAPPPQYIQAGTGTRGALLHRSIDDEFQGLRDYQRGDILNRIAWKSLAGTGHLQVKDFRVMQGDECQLDWDDFPGIDYELRLSCLCYLVLKLEREGRRYGIRLPDWQCGPDSGAGHCHAILERLALWQA